MNYPSFKPSDRISRKQVGIYLESSMHASVRRAAGRLGMPLQEALAGAVNMELSRLGYEPVLTAPRLRMFRRVNNAAAPREDQPRPARRGKLSLCGWYDRKEVESLSGVAAKLERSIQSIGQAGIPLWLDWAERSAAGDASHLEQQPA